MHDCGPRDPVEVADSGVLATDLTGMSFPGNCAGWNLVMGTWIQRYIRNPRIGLQSTRHAYHLATAQTVLSWFLPAKIRHMGKQYPEVWEQFIKTGLIGLRNKKVGCTAVLSAEETKTQAGNQNRGTEFCQRLTLGCTAALFMLSDLVPYRF